MELVPCPICGRKPRIHYYPINTGWAECKPVFRKPHLTAVVAFASPSKLTETIIVEWNKAVKHYGIG